MAQEGNVEGEIAPEEGENANTANWRLELWGEVWSDVVGFERGIAGFGFGESLADRYDKSDTRFEEELRLRNPHNSHLSVLARMGVTGAVLWTLLFGVWFRTSEQGSTQPAFERKRTEGQVDLVVPVERYRHHGQRILRPNA